jgi:tetratricopeptide (TPR) repeat protein
MNTLKNFIFGIYALTVCVLLCGHSHGQTSSRLSTTFLARGEQALLEVAVVGAQPTEIPEIGMVKNVTIRPSGRGPMTRMIPGRKLESVFEYLVSSYEIGNYVIPPIEVAVNGAKSFTEPLDFLIFNPDELQWSEVQASGKTIRYASSFRTLNQKPFENETLTTEIKVFVPEDLVVEDWGIPDFERDGVAAWRFQPSVMRSRINLLGMRYVSVAYPSTITPTRSGKVGIGPAKIRLTTREVVMDPTPRQVNTEVYLQVPKLEIEAIPLPDRAPAGFENAVGSFRLSATSTVSEVQQGDPITVDLTVSGSGNLDTLRPPSLADPNGWKVYGTTTEQRGDERRQLSGSVNFHQSIRPLEMKVEIPPFRLIYFDPKDETYKTLTTAPIPLKMHPSPASNPPPNAVPQAPSVPLERMTDILAVQRPAQLTAPAAISFPRWIGHAVAAFIALWLIARACWLRYGASRSKNPEHLARLSSLREIERSTTADDSAFLKSAGAYIEHWLGKNQTPDVQAILAERDSVCFRAEKPKSVLDSKRRAQILDILRKAAVALFFITALGWPQPVHAADIASQALTAYESAKYDDAIKLWLSAGNYDELAADTLYNIGNACYRAGSPGQAALYYRRAIARDSGHAEARQNLRFIERKYGSIAIQRPDYQYALAKFPITAWQAACWSGLWLCGLALLVFPATRPGARLRLVAVGALVLGPVLASAGALGWHYFPDDAEFSPLQTQAVIIEEKVTLHADAARTSPEIIDAPPGSLCEIISQSGRWVYIAFASKTRGWVPTESIEKIVPAHHPAPPKLQKPKADSKSA